MSIVPFCLRGYGDSWGGCGDHGLASKKIYRSRFVQTPLVLILSTFIVNDIDTWHPKKSQQKLKNQLECNVLPYQTIKKGEIKGIILYQELDISSIVNHRDKSKNLNLLSSYTYSSAAFLDVGLQLAEISLIGGVCTIKVTNCRIRGENWLFV